MNKEVFYKIYLPALRKALEKDNGITIPDPERYIEDKELRQQISIYIDRVTDDEFVDKVGYYLDARIHNFPDVGNVSIIDCKEEIWKELLALEQKFAENNS